MRMSTEDKAKSRTRIVAGAARRLRGQGLAAAGVAEVMRDAGLTHGGFYRHFASRDDMLAAALDKAFAAFLGPLAAAVAAGDAGAVARFRAAYLAPDHVAHPEMGCPVPAVGSEVANAAPQVQAAFRAGLDSVLALMAEGEGDPAARRAGALRDFATMVGAVLIARAGGPTLADEVLAAVAP